MRVEVHCGPANAAAKLILEAGETCTAEAGSMIAMSGHVGVTTTTLKKGSGGIMKAVKRMLAGESFFLNHFTSNGAPGEVWVAPVLAGDILALALSEPLIVQGGSFVAGDHTVNLDMNFQGLKTLFSGESIFWLKATGQGQIVLNAFGAIYPVDIDGEYIVDSGHIVAFPEHIKFSVTKAGKSWISSILGGEGLVMKFSGKGRIYCQSHNPQGFGSVLGAMLRPREA